MVKLSQFLILEINLTKMAIPQISMYASLPPRNIVGPHETEYGIAVPC